MRKYVDRGKSDLVVRSHLKGTRPADKTCALAVMLTLFFISSYGYGTSTTAKPVFFMHNNNNLSRICLFEDKAYSLGAIIELSNFYLYCVPEKTIETDGRLMWKKISNEKSQENKK